MTGKTRIVLVDDHALCRTGLTDLLQHRGNIEVVASLGNPDLVAGVLRELKPTLLVLEGFEGELDPDHHRGTPGGWRMHGLPWRQV